jgi:hypothetical protein
MLFLPAGKSRCRRVAAAFVAPEMLQWGLTGGKPGLERHRKARRLAKSNSDATLPKPATVKAMLKPYDPALMEAYRFQEHPILSRVEMLAARLATPPGVTHCLLLTGSWNLWQGVALAGVNEHLP